MDFTGKQGRIVEDPVEAKAIADNEGNSQCKRRHRAMARQSTDPKPAQIIKVDVGVHTTQPWYHSNLSRDQASFLVNRYGQGDGVFVVRPSRTNIGTFVLTYKCKSKVLHQQITPKFEKNVTVFSLDGGTTKFYDILQLVEFHTMNAGGLACQLTHYITVNANIESPNATSLSNTPQYVNVAVNTDISLDSKSDIANLLASPGSPSGSSKNTSPRSECSTPRSRSSCCSPN